MPNDLSKMLESLDEKLNGMSEDGKEKAVKIEEINGEVRKLAEEFHAFQSSGNDHMEKVGNRYVWKNRASAEKFVKWCYAAINDKKEESVALLNSYWADKGAIATGEKTVAGMSEGTDEDGGYTVPPQYMETIVRLIEVYGKVWGYCKIIPMQRLELKIATLESGITVYWVDEGGDFSISKPTLAQFTMTAYKLCALVPYTAELESDSFLSIATFIAVLVAEAYAKEIDRVVLRGSIANGDKFDGVFTDSRITRHYMAATKTQFEDVDADELLDMTGELTETGKVGAAFWMHPTIFDLCRKLKDDNGNYIVQHPTQGGPPTMWGYPVIQHDLLPALSDQTDSTIGVGPFIMFGNMQHFYIGDREDLSVKRSDELYFLSDQVAWRWKRRLTGRVALPGAFTLLVPATA